MSTPNRLIVFTIQIIYLLFFPLMKIKTLALKNFLGTKDATYILDKDLVTVSGRNGSGKSTIISGITYALYGIIMERSQIK